jgi:hypothetical protein
MPARGHRWWRSWRCLSLRDAGTPLARRVQLELLRRVFSDEPFEAWLVEIARELASGCPIRLAGLGPSDSGDRSCGMRAPSEVRVWGPQASVTTAIPDFPAKP